MKLKIDDEPKVGKLRFATFQSDYSDTSSPRNILKQSGLEFDHFRPYQKGGDDAKYIDWVASARGKETLVRVFTESTVLNIAVVLDVSESMIYGTTDKAKIEYAIETVINLAFGILTYGDSLGFAAFNDDIVSFVPIGSGMGKFGEIRQMAMDTSKYGGGMDLAKITSFIMDEFSKAHLIIFISDFLGGAGMLNQAMQALGEKFDIVGIMVNDKTDISIDAPFDLSLKDPYGPEVHPVSIRKAIKEYEKMNNERIASLRHFFAAIEKDLWIFSTEDSIKDGINKHMIIRSALQ